MTITSSPTVTVTKHEDANETATSEIGYPSPSVLKPVDGRHVLGASALNKSGHTFYTNKTRITKTMQKRYQNKSVRSVDTRLSQQPKMLSSFYQ